MNEARFEAIARVVLAVDARGRRLMALVAAAQLADRLVLLTTAVVVPSALGRGAWSEGNALVAVAMTGAFAAVAAGRAVARSLAQGHLYVLLHAKASASLLGHDLLAAPGKGENDRESALVDSIDIGVRICADMIPSLAADVLAAIAALWLMHRVVPARVFALGLAPAALAVLLLVAARRVAANESEKAWNGYRPVLEHFSAVLSARLEIVANGAEGALQRALSASLERWRATVVRFEATVSVVARLPLLLAGLLLVVLVLVASPASVSMSAASLSRQLLLLGAALPAFGGIVRALMEVSKVRVRVVPLATLLCESVEREPAAATAVGPPERLELQGVTFRYSREGPDVLRDASCAFSRGTVSLLIGANGGGKSTLLKVLLGLEAPARGHVMADGESVLEAAAGGSRLLGAVAYLPQRAHFSDRATVGSGLRLLAPAGDDAQALRWLERLALLDVLTRKGAGDPFSVKVADLSAGQRQRLALARIGLLDRPVWLLDEPDASLDVDAVEILRDVLAMEKASRIIVVAAHSSSLQPLADQVVLVTDGVVTAQLKPSDTPPQTP